MAGQDSIACLERLRLAGHRVADEPALRFLHHVMTFREVAIRMVAIARMGVQQQH